MAVLQPVWQERTEILIKSSEKSIAVFYFNTHSTLFNVKDAQDAKANQYSKMRRDLIIAISG